ncbi:MAG: hypothetical protein WCJ04_11625 [Actinomycetes bacterium]
MAYDPKRPRPAASPNETAPVDALLASLGADEPAPKAEPAPQVEAPKKATPKAESAKAESAQAAVQSNGLKPNGLKPQQASEVPVAAAPEEGTANRAVLLAVAGATLAVAAVLITWTRRRAASKRD